MERRRGKHASGTCVAQAREVPTLSLPQWTASPLPHPCPSGQCRQQRGSYWVVPHPRSTQRCDGPRVYRAWFSPGGIRIVVLEVKFLNHRKMNNCESICQGIVSTTLWAASWKPSSGESRRLQSWNLKEVTEGHYQEGNLRLNLTQHGKCHPLQTL